MLRRIHVPHDHAISNSKSSARAFGTFLHANDLPTGLFGLCLTEEPLHGRLEVGGDETIDHRIQAAV